MTTAQAHEINRLLASVDRLERALAKQKEAMSMLADELVRLKQQLEDRPMPSIPQDHNAGHYIGVDFTASELRALLWQLRDITLDYTELGHAKLKLEQAADVAGVEL